MKEKDVLYLDILQYLVEDRATNDLEKIKKNKKEGIDPDAIKKATEEKIKNKFDLAPYPKLKNYLIPYLSDDQSIKNIFKVSNVQANPTVIEFNDKHQYFNSSKNPEEIKSKYNKCFKFAKFIYDGIENPNSLENNDSMIHEIAYKMTVLWDGNVNNVIKAMKGDNAFAGKYQNPLHDFFVKINLCNQGKNVDLDLWRGLLNKSMKVTLDNFANADRIEQKYQKISEITNAKITIKNVIEIAPTLLYERAAENVEMATLFHQYKIDENTFNQCLELESKRTTAQKTDTLPNITIDGATLGHSGYHLVKLPKEDPRGYILGKITDCCQSIGGKSEQCVIDGIMEQNNGFYVLLKSLKNSNITTSPIVGNKINYKDFEIVGQGYSWRTNNDNICFDSWENKGRENNPVIIDFLKSFAVEAVNNHNVDRVAIGLGGKTPKSIGERSEYNEYPKKGFFYGDASNQTALHESEKLIKAREELLEIGIIRPERWLSQSLVSDFITLNKQHPDILEDIKTKDESTAMSLTDPAILRHSRVNSIEPQEFYKLMSGLDDHKILALTSENAVQAYNIGAVTLAALNNLEPRKIVALTSYQAVAAYKSRMVTFDNLKDLDIEKIEALTSYQAVDAYKSRTVTFDNLKDLELKKIVALTSYQAVDAYKSKTVTFDNLKNLELKKILALTSRDTVQAYKEKIVTFANLKDLEPEKIWALTSGDTVQAYKEKITTFSDLKDLEPRKIVALTSRDTVEAYKTGTLIFADLKKVKTWKISDLTSKDAIQAYKTGAVTFADLKDLDIEKIWALTSKDAIQTYKTKIVQISTFEEFIDRNKSNPIHVMQHVQYLKRYGHDFTKGEDFPFRDQIKAYWSDRERMIDFLQGKSENNPEKSNFKVIIDNGDVDHIKTALEFTTSITDKERELIKDKFGENTELLINHQSIGLMESLDSRATASMVDIVSVLSKVFRSKPDQHNIHNNNKHNTPKVR